jgi:hypothetical protein
MHKSGTTLVSQILHYSGINMGEDFDRAASYEQAGNTYKYERTATLALNKEILGLTDGRFIHLNAPNNVTMTENQRDQMRAIIRQGNMAHLHWGFKDPRTALVYPLWASELPVHKLIVVYRPPAELWRRFRYTSYHALQNPYVAWQLMKRWYEHNSRILTYIKNTELEFLVLSYPELMATDIEFNRLQEFVGLPLKDQRKPTLYHGNSKMHPLMKIAAWLVTKQTGCAPQSLMQEFETIRQKQLSEYSGLPYDYQTTL